MSRYTVEISRRGETHQLALYSGANTATAQAVFDGARKALAFSGGTAVLIFRAGGEALAEVEFSNGRERVIFTPETNTK